MPFRALLLGALPLAAAVVAGDAPNVPADLRATLSARFPDRQFLDIRPAPIEGMYEVFTGDSVVYTDSSGNYLLVGALVDTRTRRDLTAESLDQRNAVDFETLPFERAVKVVKGDGSRRVAVFADPFCPFCQNLERELARLNDVTIYTFLYPIESLHPGATERALSIWCAPDRGEAWVQWMRRQKEPAAATCEGDPLEANRDLGVASKVFSTPTLFFPSGRRVSDVPRTAEIEQLLDAAPAAARQPESDPIP